jgi:hypothetical protein
MANPIDLFVKNAQEALSLLDLHTEKTGSKPGRRFGVEILNKSAIVLMTASWEAFLEDCVTEAFDFIVAEVPHHSRLPKGLLKATAKLLKEDANEIKVWDLAGDGWKAVLKAYQKQMLQKHLGSFNTPKAANVDALFKAALDLSPISLHWSWKGMPVAAARVKLERYLKLRHEIAHRVNASETVFKEDAADYAAFIIRLAAQSATAVRQHVFALIGKYPWGDRSLK